MTESHPAIAELTRIVGDDGILTGKDELLVYECDGFPITKGMPTAAVFPTSTQQVSQCVKVLARYDIPIVPRGSGTGLTGAAVVYGSGVLINTTRMNRIESVDLSNRVAVVQAGVRNLALSDALKSTGLRFSPDPSSQRASTIGGNASTNAGGINTLKHGVTTNHVVGMEVVLADGTIQALRADHNYDGIGADLPGLMCASEGTLGIICRIWCRLVPNPTHMRTFYATFDSVRDACQTVSDVIADGIVPTSMEMMDASMIQIIEGAFHLGFSNTAAAMLLLEIDGVEQVLDEQMQHIIEIAESNHGSDIKQCSDEQTRTKLWSARKKAFGAVGRVSHSYCTQDACVPRSTLPDVMEEVERIGERYDIKITNVFHAGDGNIHPILLFDEDDPDDVQKTLRASEEILEHCISIGGTITGEHGIGVEKLHLMDKMFTPETIETFQSIKFTLDPDHRINDGKHIPSDTLKVEILEPVTPNVPGGAF